MSEVRKQLAQYATKDDERNMLNDEELKARILQNLQRTTQQRLMKVMYNVTIYLKDGSTLSRVFRIREADLLYGTK